jgi:hypothetical protein
MTQRLVAIALAAGLLLPAWVASPAEAQGRSSAAASLPITGSVAGGGSFVGTLGVQRFAARGDRIVAVGAISGVVTSAGGQSRSGIKVPVELPVAVSQGPGGAAIQRQRGTHLGPVAPLVQLVQDQSCGVLLVEIAGPTTIDLLGLMVTLDPVRLEIGGDSAGPLGNLVCQALDLVNNVVGLVGLLNQILGLLGGLTGGLAGAVPA